MITGGLISLGIGSAGLVTAVLRGAAGDVGSLFPLAVIGTVGVTMFGVGVLRLPGWARVRRRQMEEIAERLTADAESQPAEETGR